MLFETRVYLKYMIYVELSPLSVNHEDFYTLGDSQPQPSCVPLKTRECPLWTRWFHCETASFQASTTSSTLGCASQGMCPKFLRGVTSTKYLGAHVLDVNPGNLGKLWFACVYIHRWLEQVTIPVFLKAFDFGVPWLKPNVTLSDWWLQRRSHHWNFLGEIWVWVSKASRELAKVSMIKP